MLLNAAKCQGYNFDHFWVIKGKPTGVGGGKITPPPPPQPHHTPHPLPTKIRINTAQIHSTKLEFEFCAGSNPVCSVSEV